MANFIRKYGRYVTALLLIAMLASLIPIAMNGFKFNEANASGLSEDDKKMAADISNTTGAKIEDIYSLKKQGKSWNEILEYLKKRGDNAGDRDKRDKLLANDGLGEDYVDKLKKEGFKLEEIMEAKLLLERVSFQLHEITGKNDLETVSEKEKLQLPQSSLDNLKDDTAAYSELEGKLDIKIAVRLMLKLKNEFGSLEKVFDEYLFSLQVGLNLENYLTDKEGYLKQKEEKSIAINEQTSITMAKIEEKMLKKIQDSNPKGKVDTLVDTKKGTAPDNTAVEDVIPKPPLPEVKDVRPKNPADEIMNEIKQINPIDK